jgi:hypothetical protein
MIDDSDDKLYQCSIEGDPPSHLSTEQAFHGSVTENAAVFSYNACIVGDSVENHLLQSWIREFYAGTLFAGVIWTV